MITTPTVLVLGAGASMPFGFPSGATLKAQLYDRDPRTIQVLVECGADEGDIIAFREALRRSGQPSIDAFLEKRPEFSEIGKLAIAYRLIQCENEDNLLGPRSDGEENWYEFLFKRMDEGASLGTFSKNRLSVITFNYDRSFEHFLYSALSASYGADHDKIAKVAATIPVIHVHGQLGLIGWQFPKYGLSSSRSYEPILNPDTMFIAAKGIRIVHEPTEAQVLSDAFDLLRGAQRILFLGFGYHRSNLERLRITEIADGQRYISGGFYKCSDAERQHICRSIRAMTGGHPNDRVCQFLRNDTNFQSD